MAGAGAGGTASLMGLGGTPPPIPTKPAAAISSVGAGAGSGSGASTAAVVDSATLLNSFLQDTTDLERKTEIDRVNNRAFKLNPFDVLNLPTNATTVEVNKQFRDLSLLVHPDKFQAEWKVEAEKAFNLLTAAKNELLDEQKRSGLQELIVKARAKILDTREKEFKKKRKEEVLALLAKDPVAKIVEPTMPDYTLDPEWDNWVKAEVKEMLIDREWRTRQLLKMAAQEEQLAVINKAKKEEEKKTKEQTEQEWEQNRDKRVGSWRDFMKGNTKGGLKRLRQPKMPKLTAEDPDRLYVKRVKRTGGQVGAGPQKREDDDEDRGP